jgi:hypothetical protein
MINRSITALLLLASTAFAQSPTTPGTTLDTVVVTARKPVENPTGLAQNEPVGPTGRPEWTSARRFTTTRVYIQKDPWEIGVEQWWRFRENRDNTVQNKFQEEIEIGLPYRMQADIYLDWFADGAGHAYYGGVAFELRWALADWGRIPLNPALYAEYKIVDPSVGPDVYEFKLLLGQQIVPRLDWGLNVVFEQEIGGSRTTEWQVSQGISYTILDQKLSAGVEMKWVNESERDSRGQAENKFLIGPTMQWRPTKNTHLDLTCMWGTNGDAPRIESYVIFGFDFGKIGGAPSHYKPTSVRSN